MDKLVTPPKPPNFYEYNDKLITIPNGCLLKLSGQEDTMKVIFEYLLLSTTRKDRSALLLTNKKIYKWVCEIDPYPIIKAILSKERRGIMSNAVIFGKNGEITVISNAIIFAKKEEITIKPMPITIRDKNEEKKITFRAIFFGKKEEEIKITLNAIMRQKNEEKTHISNAMIFSKNEKIKTISSAIIFGKLEHYPKKLTTTLDTKFLLSGPTNYDNPSFQSLKEECLLNYPVDLDHIKNTEEVKQFIETMKKNADYFSKLTLDIFRNLMTEENNELFSFLNQVSNEIGSLFKTYPKLNIKKSKENDVLATFASKYQWIIISLINRFNQSGLDNNRKLILEHSISTLILLRYALTKEYQEWFNLEITGSSFSLDLGLEAVAGCDLLNLASKFNLDSLKDKLFDSEGFLLYCFHQNSILVGNNTDRISDRILNNTEFCLQFFKEEDRNDDGSLTTCQINLVYEILDRSLGDKKAMIDLCKIAILDSESITYDDLPDILMNDIECLLHCIKNYNENKNEYDGGVLNLSEEYRGAWGWLPFNLLSEELQQNPQIFNACKKIFMEDLEIKRCRNDLIPLEFLSDRECVLAYIKCYPQNLKELSDELQNDEEIVSIAFNNLIVEN